ncbi:MAG: DUF1851 domain-containing protein [Maritimibacter sp.]|nr:DUF1851 domain-containing protein [Maritimibacter sp.]
MLKAINKYWGWTGMNGTDIVGQNTFCNLLILGDQGRYWRICPEELSCKVVARDAEEFQKLIADEDFQLDWNMSNLVALARRGLGPLEPGHAYYLVIPAVFGGPYDATNIRTVPLAELIHHAGDWARAIKDLPEGGQIELGVIE